MVYIGIPTYSGDIHGTCVAGLIEAVTYCKTQGIGFAVDIIPHDAFIGKARNTLVHRFLKSNFRDMFFIDADVGFDAIGLAMICKAQPEIVMGLYQMKTKENRYPALMADPIVRHPSDDNLVKLHYGPAGFMRMRREVFEAMKKAWPDDYYMDGRGDKVYDFFPNGRQGNHFYGEDLTFCQRAQQLGFDIWAMQGVTLKHSGEKCWQSTWRIDVPAEEMQPLGSNV